MIVDVLYGGVLFVLAYFMACYVYGFAAAVVSDYRAWRSKPTPRRPGRGEGGDEPGPR